MPSQRPLPVVAQMRRRRGGETPIPGTGLRENLQEIHGFLPLKNGFRLNFSCKRNPMTKGLKFR